MAASDQVCLSFSISVITDPSQEHWSCLPAHGRSRVKGRVGEGPNTHSGPGRYIRVILLVTYDAMKLVIIIILQIGS